MYLEGRTSINPTEDPEKVLRCISNVFPNCDIAVSENIIEFHTNDINSFVEILGEQQIRDTAAMVMVRGLEGDSVHFHLNKQAAFMGRVNFTDGDSTLGDILITIREGGQDLIDIIRPSLD